LAPRDTYIEKSRFHKGEYVGYAAGTVWRITKIDGRRWLFTRNTLAEVSEALEASAAYLLHVKP
jgi:hypothetical protein